MCKQILLASSSKRHLKILVFLLICSLISSGCGTRGDSGAAAEDLLPNMPEEYLVHNVDNVVAALTDLGVTSALTLSSAGTTTVAKLSATALTQINVMDSFSACMINERGGAAFRVYTHTIYPQSVGIVAIFNQDRLTSFSNIVSCLTPENHLVADQNLNPCLGAWEYERRATYYIFYAGTTRSICNTFEELLPK